jgi:hypothetical protein
MSVLATIRDHSGRIDRGIQSLLVLSGGAAAVGAFELSESLATSIIFALSAVATGLALLALMYMLSMSA